MKRMTKLGLLAATLATVWGSALADINVGVVVSATGPAASLGIPEKNTVALMPRTVAGQKVNYIILDDASDTTAAVANTRKLISESKVDVILGSSITPNSLAMVDVVSEAKTPMITLAASAKIVEPVDAKKFWVFKTPQHDAMMAAAIGEHMAKAGIKTVGYIGFNDAYGESWLQEFRKVAEAKGLKLTATEAYSRSDTSVTGQTLKLMAAKPDAVLIAGSGTPAALPQKSLRSAATRARSTRPTAWPMPTSCAWAARMWKARCCPPAPCWWLTSCPTATRSRSPPSPMWRPTRPPTARARLRPLARIPGMRAACSKRRFPPRSRRPSPARPSSAPRCAMRWSRPRTWPAPTASST